MGGEDAEDKDPDKAATFAATSAGRTTIRVSYASLIRTFERLHIELAIVVIEKRLELDDA